MDHEKLSTLTHYVTFVQTNLDVNSEMLQLLLEGRVLSAEEISLIEKDKSNHGRVLELLCVLKKKDNMAFDKFVLLIDEMGFTHVSEVLKYKRNPRAATEANSKTFDVLASYLGNVNESLLALIAQKVILKEEHDKLVAHWKEQVEEAKKMTLAPKSAALSPQAVDDDTLQNKQYDMSNKENDEKYQQLAKEFENLRQEHDQSIKLNSEYAALITKLNKNTVGRSEGTNWMAKQWLTDTRQRKLAKTDNSTVLKGGQHQLTDVSNKQSQAIEELLRQKEDELRRLRQADKQLHKKLISKDERNQVCLDERDMQTLINYSTSNGEKMTPQRNTVNQKEQLEEEIKHLTREKKRIELNIRQRALRNKHMSFQAVVAKASLARARGLLRPITTTHPTSLQPISESSVQGVHLPHLANKYDSIPY